MPDQQYQTYSYKLEAPVGLVARYTADAIPQGSYLNLANLELRAENALATRLGLFPLSTDKTSNFLLGGPVYSVNKLQGIGQMYRYAGAAGQLWRRAGSTQGAFSSIASGLSGSPFSVLTYRPAATSLPYAFIADKNVLLKDNGSGNPQNWGITPPLQPPSLQIGDPAKIPIEEFGEADTSSFTLASVTAASITNRVQGTVAATGSGLGIVTFVEIPPVASSYVRSSNVTTVTTSAAHGWVTGMRISVSLPSDTSFNKSSVVITVTGTTTFTYANVGPNTTVSSQPSALSAMPTIQPYMLMSLDSGPNNEAIMVLSVIPGVGFKANQTKPHTASMTYADTGFAGTVAANATGSVSKKGVFDFSGTNAAPINTPVAYVSSSRTGGVSTLNFGVLASPPDWRPGNLVAVNATGAPLDFDVTKAPITAVTIDGGGNFIVSYAQPGLPNETGTGGTAQKTGGSNTVADDTDFFNLAIQVSDPFAVLEVRVFFDVGDGSFTQDYYYKSITAASSQPAVSGTLSHTRVLPQTVFDRAVGLTDNRRMGYEGKDLLPVDLQALRQLRPAALNTGKTAWSSIQMMRGEFVPVGAAGTSTNDWSKVVAWKVSITTQPNSGVNFALDDFVFVGGADLDSFNGQPYDYRITFYNINTGCESNPSIELASSQFLSPRRQPILVNLNQSSFTSNTPGSITSTGGGAAWSNPANFAGTSGSAQVFQNGSLTSQSLKAESLGFGLVPGSEIVGGFPVSFNYWWTGSGGLVSSTVSVQLLKNGVPFGAAVQIFLLAIGGQGSSSSPLRFNFTFPSTGLTIADINNAAFGFQVTLKSGSNTTFVNANGATMGVLLGTPIDNQVTHWRIYRRGGSLTQAWYFVDQVPIQTTTYQDIIADATIEVNPQLVVDADAPVTSLLPTPLNESINSITQPAIPGIATISLAGTSTNIFLGQLVTIGNGDNQEQAYVLSNSAGTIQLWLQFAHSVGETVSATTQPQVSMNLAALAFDQAFLAGDPNNPHVLYYSNPFSPETFPQENFIEVGSPDAPIMALVVLRGFLYVFTTKTVYQIFAGQGAVPVAVPTGVQHGLVSHFGWAASENIVYYASYDGIYAFQGSGAAYLTQTTEWIWTGKNLGPLPAIDPTQLSAITMVYGNHELFVTYVDKDAVTRRQIYSDVYHRWRNDDQSAGNITSMFFEQDTGTFMVGKSDGMVYLDRVNDYDSGGYVAGVETKNPINFNLQTGQLDQGAPKVFKKYNELTIDATLNNQIVNVFLIYDSGATVVPMGTITGTTKRTQFQMVINQGNGTNSLDVGLRLTGAVTAKVVLHEVHIRALTIAESRRSFDTYWIGLGVDEWHMYKQGFFEYTAPDPAGVTVNAYVDGDMTTPRFTFTLPQTSIRTAIKVRFPATKCKLLRLVGSSPGDFMLHSDSQIEHKKLGSNKGYERAKLSMATTAA